MRSITIAIIAVSVLILAVPAVAGPDSVGSSEAIAVVVHPLNPVTDISMAKLQRIYLGRKTTFDDGHSIVLMEYKPLQEQFYQVLLNRSASKMRKLWMKKVFAGDYATPPVIFDKISEAVKFLSDNSGSIFFLPPEAVSDSMKVIRVSGLQPEDDNYPLK